MFFNCRHESLGERGRLWQSRRLVQDDFTVDWSKGVYSMKWASSRVSEVTHISGIKADVREYNLNESKAFGGNPCDITAVFKKNRQELKAMHFFKGDLNQPWSREGYLQDAEKALAALKMTESVRTTLASASTSAVFSMAKAHVDQKAHAAISARVRVPSKGLAAPLTMTMVAEVATSSEATPSS